MKKLILSAAALLVMSASAFTLHNDRAAQSTGPELATNAAYRDGMYLGKLAAECAGQYRVAVARWSTSEDRDNFAAGYEQAYKAAVSTRAAK